MVTPVLVANMLNDVLVTNSTSRSAATKTADSDRVKWSGKRYHTPDNVTDYPVAGYVCYGRKAWDGYVSWIGQGGFSRSGI